MKADIGSPFAICEKKKRLGADVKFQSRNQRIGWGVFVCYLLCLSYLVFFAEAFGRTGREEATYSYNLILFQEIRRFWVYRKQLGFFAVFVNLVGNVLWFCPFGFILPVISRRGERAYVTILLGAGFSLGIELVQLVTKVGSFDVDDILLNTVGVILGYISYRVLQKLRSQQRKQRKRK
ncbi:MAG: VanZ family protein [bacterium]|nr:VanZ family protein [bacterium]